MSRAVIQTTLIICFLALLSQAQLDPSATFVFGQSGSFTTNAANSPSLNANSLKFGNSAVYDALSGVYVSDYGNHRVLYYNSGQTTAIRVYGQSGSFTSGTPNTNGISSSSLNFPTSLTLDGGNGLYVSDSANHRIIHYPSGFTSANFVYGQGGSFSSGTANNGGISASSLFSPGQLAFDTSGNFYACDLINNRVLKFVVGNSIAVDVWGQNGFTQNLANKGGSITTDTLNLPAGVAVNIAGLYVSDSGNNRIVFYAGFSKTASRVYGQSGSFTTGTVNVLSANSLNNPSTLAFSTLANGLYVGDSGNARALYYTGSSTTASTVYGQGGSFTTASIGVTNKKFSTGIAGISWFGDFIYIGDLGNNRVLTFPSVESFTTSTSTTSSSSTTAPGTPSVTCFHESTMIQYKTKFYTLQDLSSGQESECKVPHVVRSNGYKIGIECRRESMTATTHLRLTGDHLIKTFNGAFVSAEAIQTGTRVLQASNLSGMVHCQVVSKDREFDQRYFGLNCLESLVFADGFQTSTFGNYHYIPSVWMSTIGRWLGIETASRWGDSVAQFLHRGGAL